MASPPAAAAAVPTYSVTGRVNAYTTPHLPCIHDYGTVNPSKRCIHGCLYCYANASPLAGAKDAIGVFDTLPEMMAAQLKKKGDSAPERMYFSTACDAFQPIPAVQAATRGAFAAILAHPGKQIGFLTKGLIEKETMDLLIANHDRVYAQIGLITVDQTVTDVFEPRAAKPQDRLAQAKILVDAGIYTAARIDPIIPGVTDTPERLKALFAGLASAGIKKVAASYLFTRPSISRELESVVGTNENVRTMFREFESGTKELELHCKSKMTCLTAERRVRGYALIKEIAAEYGITVSVCRCKNTDIEDVSICNIAGLPTPRPAPSKQMTLDGGIVASNVSADGSRKKRKVAKKI